MTLPSEAREKPGLFDRFADRADFLTSKAWYFAFSVFIVVVWFPVNFFIDIDTAQLIINTPTTILTFLMVSVQQNKSKRNSDADHQKQNAMVLYMLSDEGEGAKAELRAAFGLEDKEAS